MSTTDDLANPQTNERTLQFIDIGVNLTDPVFHGLYHGRRKHDDDFDAMLDRSKNAGVLSMIITGGSLSESRSALEKARMHNLYATVGCHPTRSAEFDKYDKGPEGYLQALDELVTAHLAGSGRAVAIGECGLDYDRLHFADEETQRRNFRIQLSLAKKHNLPLFLHSRAAHSDFLQILREEGFEVDGGRALGGRSGVVHSFTGTVEEARELVKMGFYIGVNGCSLKTEENLETAKSIPLNRIMLETDAPWCTMTSTHASSRHLATLPPHLRDLYFPPSTKPEKFALGKTVKGRNEPCAIGGVAWVVFSLHKGEKTDEGEELKFEDVVGTALKNTVDLFGLVELEREG